jgi:hypothetical protein
MTDPTDHVRPLPDCPLVVAYGLGVDSTAMLVEFVHRGIRPDRILFADTGGEILWLGRHHPRLLDWALAIEANARPNLTSVKGLGRSVAWADFLDAVDRPPLFPNGL